MLGPCARAAIVVAAVFLLLATPVSARRIGDGSPGGDAWLSYGGGDQVTNDVDAQLQPSRLALVWRDDLDGPIYGSPLYDQGTVFVATEAGSVYAVDAATGAIRWRDQLGAVQELHDGCGTWGITSTPAIDPVGNVLYAIGGDGVLHALDLTTGAEEPSFPLRLITRPSVEYVWGGLRIVDGTLYVPVASYCDETDPPEEVADGRIVAVDLATQQTTSLDTVPGPDNLGGVWGYGGVSSDGTYLYAGVGNAFSPAGEDAGYGDHLIQFTPAPDLRVVAADKPAQVLPFGDQDFGSAPLVFQPPGCPPLVAADNKSGYAFVWRRSSISAGPLVSFGLADGVSAFVGAPSWSDSLGMLFFAEAKTGLGPGMEGVAAFRVAKDCRFVRAWRTPTGSGNQTAPLIAGGLVFTGAGTGGVDVLDAQTGTIVWHQDTAYAASAPFAEGDGRVYAPVGSSLEAIGDS